MTNKNTMSLSRYILYNLIVLAALNYMCVSLFLYLGNSSTGRETFFHYIIFSLAMTVGGMMLTYDKRRNYFSVFINVLAPAAFAVLFYCANVSKKLLIPFAVCGLALSAGYTYLVFKHRPKSKDRISYHRIISSCRWRSFLGVRTIITLLFVLLASISLVHRVYTVSLMARAADEENRTWAEYTVDNQYQSLKNLDGEQWIALSLSEKLSVLNTVKYIEMNALGIDHDIQLVCESLGETTIGSYQESTYTMFLNEKWMSSADADEWVNCICHEIYHAKEYQLCRLYESMPEQYRNMPEFRNVPVYQYEFSHYITGETDDLQELDAYGNQKIESEARRYALAATWKYMNLCNK